MSQRLARASRVSALLLTLPLLACTESGTPGPETTKAKPLPTVEQDDPEDAEQTPEADAERLDAATIAAEVQATMDASVNPCDDFYQYACGGWLANTPRPPDKPRYGRGFGVVADRNKAVLREILETAGRDATGDENDRKLGLLYASCMDEATIDAAGIKPLHPYLQQIDAVEGAGDFVEVVGAMQRGVFRGGRVLFSGHVTADDKNPDIYVVQFGQGGTGLPDRDFYLKTDDTSRELLAKYQAHVARMLGFFGEDEARTAEAAKNVVAFETELAKRAVPRHELRDPNKTYNKLGVDGLKALDAAMPWDRFFAGFGYPESQFGPHVVVSVPTYFKGLGGLLKKTDAQTLRDYLRWHLINGTAEHLSRDIVDADFELAKVLSGAESLPPRWERCVDFVNFGVRELVGPAFVKKKFAGESKDIALSMLQGIETAFEANLPGLSWMDDDTRARAIEKAKAVANKIGYPDKWRDYSKLQVKAEDHLGNVVAINRFEVTHNADRVGGPVDRDEWHMPPAMVNAYYNSSMNEMVFPAGILQPPYFSRDFPMAMNFGAIGMVMGHELTHGFDDSGRKFDGKGVLHEWWSEEASTKFDAQAQCVDDLYSAIEVLPDVKLNGKLTLGENIADFGGIKEAHRAYKDWAAANGGDKQPHVDGLTNDQLFFVAFAQGWCTHQSDEVTRMRAMTDTHSPPKQRVNVPLAHFPGFWATFSCEEGAAMHPKDVCEVW
ncbi:MAG: M13 family metallopeptidase [Myxococcales bacterium]|nr:M13 family metallopeptidase [Myxococcales bacterium]MCB9752838.1 M13 family metallopeptidase [Myxococcales bacterium]